MKKIFLTSSLGTNIKVDGVKIPVSLDNTNHIIEQLKEAISDYKKIIYMTSTPSNYENNDVYSSVVFKSFELSGMIFEKYVVVDYRYKDNLDEEIADASLILLSGGDTKEEMAFFEELDLRTLLKSYDGVLLGQSAGSMNMAKIVVSPPEGISQIGNNYTFNGLDLVDINIEPHFILLDEDSEERIFLRKELLEISKQYPLYALVDGSHISIIDGKTKIYGEVFYIENCAINKINTF